MEGRYLRPRTVGWLDIRQITKQSKKDNKVYLT